MLTDSNNPLASLLPWEEPPVEVDLAPVESAPARPLPEMPFSINTFITVKGQRCQVTVRSVDDNAGLARFEAILDRYCVEPVAPVQETAVLEAPADAPDAIAHVPAPPAPPAPAQETASQDHWCTFHQEQMRHQLSHGGWAHKVGDRLWCAGHWCAEHDTRFWENTSKDGKSTYYSHALQPKGSGTCYERKRARA